MEISDKIWDKDIQENNRFYIISNEENRPGSKIDDTRKQLIMYISITIA